MTVKKDIISEQKYLFHQGKNYRTYDLLGAHPAGKKPKDGIVFRVWAPRAQAVSLVSDRNGWDPEAEPMVQMADDPTIWELTAKEMRVGDLYKYAVTADDGRVMFKADPYAFESEKGTVDEGHQMASRVSDLAYFYQWGDQEWIRSRDGRNHYESPMNIYEVHLGSWRHRKDGSVMSYRELAGKLIPYVKKMGYTHLEVMPLTEYPFEGSWGYQVTGYFSITSRYGTPDDFKYFVDSCHRAGIGIIMDWVPAHFPKDAHGLIDFDGHHLYEDSEPNRMEHKGWGTRAFDFGRPEVLSFLISDAFFFCDVYHIDGLRVDAVAAMLYLDYDRKAGEWTPNKNGGRENLEAIHFLREVNSDVLSSFPGVMMIAEESTAWPMVTRPPEDGGLGFNYKWNMGWMNDTLAYFSKDPIFRGGMHHNLTFSMTYAYSENFILPISHDEVVHGKCSMLSKMPGEYDDKFAGLRSFFVYMMTHPGKKLTFMGAEFGQFIEWDEKKELDWMLLDYEKHRKLRNFVQELNHFYKEHPSMWKKDDAMEGFRWIDADNAQDNTFTYYRTDGAAPDPEVELVALNLSGLDFPVYDIGVPDAEYYEVMIDTDRTGFGGTGSRRKRRYHVEEGPCNGYEQHITVPLPKFSGIILQKCGDSHIAKPKSTGKKAKKAPVKSAAAEKKGKGAAKKVPVKRARKNNGKKTPAAKKPRTAHTENTMKK